MCRLVAYLGKKISLSELIIEPHHSLYRQSWQAKETAYAKLNADGFGFGWYDRQGKAGVYRNAAPIWADGNLPDLSHALQSNLWLAMVRSATSGSAYGVQAVQPFRHRRCLFMHNGFIKNMGRIRKKIMALISSESAGLITGASDSEYLFALFCEKLKRAKSLRSALRQTLLWCADNFSSGNQSMLNVIVSDGGRLCASRFAIHEKEPTLYLNHKKEAGFPDKLRLLASERFSNGRNWRPLPPASLVTLQPHKEPDFSSLC